MVNQSLRDSDLSMFSDIQHSVLCCETSDHSFYFHFSLEVGHAEDYFIRVYHYQCVSIGTQSLKAHLYIRDNCLPFHPVGQLYLSFLPPFLLPLPSRPPSQCLLPKQTALNSTLSHIKTA